MDLSELWLKDLQEEEEELARDSSATNSELLEDLREQSDKLARDATISGELSLERKCPFANRPSRNISTL